jgi:hypothetical protein
MRNLRIAITVGALASIPAIAVSSAGQHASASGHISVLPSDLKWGPAPSVGPSVQMAVIEGDLKSSEPFIFRLKLPANFKVAVHTHPVVERVTVISGTFHLGIGDKFDAAKAKAYPVGGVAVMPPGMAMFAYTGAEETVIQIHGSGPWGIKYLNPGDDPLKK